MEALTHQIIQHIINNWAGWLFAGAFSVSSFFYRKTAKKNEAIGEGLQALLRSEIIDKYNYYKDKGYCPIYAKENMKRLYKPYEALGGNDVAKGMKDELLKMNTKPKGEKKDD